MENKTGKKVGRPSEYKPYYVKRLLKFFKKERTKIIYEKFYYKNGDEKEKEVEVANELPTIEGFCIEQKIGKGTFHRWVKANKEFRNAYKKCKIIEEEFWKQNSLRGLYNPAFTIFLGKNVFGWKDKKETDITSGGEKIKPILGGISTFEDVSENNSDNQTSETTQED